MGEVIQLKPTDVSSLQSYAKGAVVELPPFGPDQPFIARIKRPSLLMLVKAGKIPNTLLAKASEMFSNGSRALDPDDKQMMSEVFDIIDIMAQACLVEPSYQDIKDAGLELSDDQLMFIFNYSQNGVKALEQFRKVK